MTNTKKTVRNQDGLIEGLTYHFNEDNSINWRKMIKLEFLVSNRDRTSETDITKLEDKDLLILLGGIKDVAQKRGFTSVTYDVKCPSADYVVATCTIDWIPNYETENNSIRFSAIGDASPANTKDFAKYFLGPIAENRAFIRCVRNFLKINIVGQDEIGKSKNNIDDSSDSTPIFEPNAILEKVMKEKNISFSKLKDKLIKENYANAENFVSVSDIPKIKIFELIERIQKMK